MIRIAAAVLLSCAGLVSAQATMTPVRSNDAMDEQTHDQMQDEMKDSMTDKLKPRTGLPVGTKAPSVKVVDDQGKEHTLADLYASAEGPVVLLFYRGGWCPYCTRHLAELGSRWDELKATGATVYAISPESWDKLAVSEEKGKLKDIERGYTLLSDAHQDAAQQYNLIFSVDEGTQKKYRNYGIDLEKWNADGEWTLPVPAAYVIDRSGTIRFAHVDEDYSKRIDVDKLLEHVRKIGG